MSAVIGLFPSGTVPVTDHAAAFWASSGCGDLAWAHCIFFCCSHLATSRFGFASIRARTGKVSGGRRKAWSASCGWKHRCLPPSRPDPGRGEPAGAGGGAGLAVPARGRASTPARAAADPPESTVVINRPFSEMMPPVGAGMRTEPGGAGKCPRDRASQEGPPARFSPHRPRLPSPPGATEAFSARKEL